MTRVASCSCAFAVLLAIFAALLDASYWNASLDRETIERASLRFCADGTTIYSKFSSNEQIEFGRDAWNERLRDSAKEFCRNCDQNPNSRRVVARGLARWGVEYDDVKKTIGEACAREEFDAWAEQADFNAVRSQDERASQCAEQTLNDWDDGSPDDDLLAAIDFLRELDPAPKFEKDVKETGSKNTFTFVSFAESSENPCNAFGVVAIDEFVPSATLDIAKRACDASARLFLLLTFGVFSLAPRDVRAWNTSIAICVGVASAIDGAREFLRRVTRPIGTLLSYRYDLGESSLETISTRNARPTALMNALDSVRLLI